MSSRTHRFSRLAALPLLAAAVALGGLAMSQTVLPEIDSEEAPGPRPYEMAWAERREPAPPTIRFDRLAGWTLEVEGGAQAALQATRARNLWDRPVTRLRYRGDGKAESRPRVLLVPPEPVPVPRGADSVDVWLHGNRWEWENPPDTPPLRILLELRDGGGKGHSVEVGRVRWDEWWLMHRRLPVGLPEPLRLVRVVAADGWQPEWREIYLDSLRFYKEELPPLRFEPRPKRNLTLFDGQSPGANTGPGKLPFPTRERTILPMQLSGRYRTASARQRDGAYSFTYRGSDCRIVYRFDPRRGLGGLTAEVDDQPLGALLAGSGVRRAGGGGEGAPTSAPELRSASLKGGVLTAEYGDGTTLRLRLWQKSLVLDVIHPGGQAEALDVGQMEGLTEPRVLRMPYLTYGGSDPGILVSRAGSECVFTSLWLDWYRSNGSELYAEARASETTARINGGVRYHPRTDGTRNPLYERLFLTVSPRLEEVLPVIPNPRGRNARAAVDKLWQESWGPDDYEAQKKRSRMLRAHGIEKLIQCNHEIAWRDNGESFTLRLHAAPKKGGDEALRSYVAHQRGLGWLSGLYTNYTDFAPVNEHWTPDAVQRTPDGEWRPAWPRCYALKPLRAVELDALLAPQVKVRYGSNSAYTDVHTAVAPWAYNDYDARVPGAGTFAQTFYAYGELLRNDSRVYGGPIFSEGTYHWLYAGLADGNYAIAYNGRKLVQEPLLPVFDLLQIHPKECDIGMGWTSEFCSGIPDWNTPANLDRSIDRFLLHTLAYGHIGWLVEEAHGVDRACRSYYMLQQVQARYGLKTPTRIAYWDGERLCDVSEAVVRDLPATRRQLYVAYPGGLQLWLNDHPTETWRVRAGDQEIALPPAGWAAYQPGELLSYSAMVAEGKADYLRSAAYTYLDGRGRRLSVPEAESSGALAIRPLPGNALQVLHISGDGPFTIRRPYGTRGALVRCEAFDVDGAALPPPKVRDDGSETRVEPVEKGLRYVLAFDGSR